MPKREALALVTLATGTGAAPPEDTLTFTMSPARRLVFLLASAFALWGSSCTRSPATTDDGGVPEAPVAEASPGKETPTSATDGSKSASQKPGTGGSVADIEPVPGPEAPPPQHGGGGNTSATGSATQSGGMRAVSSGGTPAAENEPEGEPSPPSASVDAGGSSDAAVPEPPVVRAVVVTSVEGNYWQESAPLVTDDVPDVVVHREERLHQWLGFGGTFDEAGWDALAVLTPELRNKALRLLFDPEEGLELVFGRLPIGAAEYSLERHSLNDVAGDYANSGFTIARDEETLIPYVRAALELRPDLELWAIPWSPPAWMKTNGSLDGGSIRDETEVLGAYATYLARYVEAYGEAGLDIEAIAIQNDPSFAGDYPSCVWDAELYHRFETEYLVPTFETRGLAASLWLGAFGDSPDTLLVDELLSDSAAIAAASAVALQWSTQHLVPSFLERTSLPIIQSQHAADNAPWEMPHQSDRAPNDDDAALRFWSSMFSWLKRGVSAYHAWHLVLDTVGLGLGTGTPWPKNALLTVDRATGALNVTHSYHVFRHVAGFVKPGGNRVAVTASEDLDALAFENPGGEMVVVLHNHESTARGAVVGIDATSLEVEVPALGWVTVAWPP